MENQFFNNKKPNFQKLIRYGFKKNNTVYSYSILIMNDDFKLDVEILPHNKINTQIIEIATGEKYTLHLTSAQGAFVGKIRDEYNSILCNIAQVCFEPDIFKNEDTQNVIDYIRKKYDSELEYLWEKSPENAIARHKNNKKWYLIIMTIKKNRLGFDSSENIEVINLRTEAKNVPNLIKQQNIFPGYHMNKKHWITIILDGSMPIKQIFELIDNSYDLTKK